MILITEITRSLHTRMSNAVHLAMTTFNVYVRSIILDSGEQVTTEIQYEKRATQSQVYIN